MLTCEFAYFWKETFLFINLKAGSSNFTVYLFLWHGFLLEYPTHTYAKQVSIIDCKKVKYNNDNNKTQERLTSPPCFSVSRPGGPQLLLLGPEASDHSAAPSPTAQWSTRRDSERHIIIILITREED